jgi:uncharacterized YigZ family protein
MPDTMDKDQYRTLSGISQGLYKEKGSKFISIAIPVENQEDIRINLEKLRKEYHDARHHCYAYRIGEGPSEFRYNDDGEPSATAGKPIYGQILSYDLTNILIVVIRYFGGIKLGTGGLIQAYKTAAKDAIDNGALVIKTWTEPLGISFDYLKMNEVMKIIKEENLKIVNQDSGENCRIVLEIRKGQSESIRKKFFSNSIAEFRII